ncbi:MAG: TrkH family potassium uptake protein [Acidimicrobiales bacterium]|nr:TrkH family potassium uptake protein [Acidimicrobiales bacterium]
MSVLAPFAVRRQVASASLHIAGLSVLAVAGASASGLVVELVYRDDQWRALAASTVGLGILGILAWRTTSLPPNAGGPRGAVRAVGVAWISISLAAAVPFVVADVLPWDLALFESVSGLTGTGSTVLAPIEGNTHGILFYRQMTQWVGGMGVVVLAVAVLPFLGVGGLQLFRAESPGPTADQLVPRVSDTARRLWGVYCALTALATLVLLATGLSLYDAVSHAATGVGTGGFSPYNDSISHFDSATVEVGIMVAMALGAVKFPLFYAAFRGRDLGAFWRSSEFRFLVWVVVASTAFVTVLNWRDGMTPSAALRDSSFNVVSLISSCGFGTADFTRWVPATQIVLLFLMVTGSMAGSTSGALKLFRVQVVAKHAWREVRRVRHPSGVFPLRLGREPVPEDIVRSVLGYVMFYFLIAVAGFVVLATLGADVATSVGSVITAMGGVGPGLGDAGPAANFLVFDFAQRSVLIVLMLVGRLEIFPLLLFLLPVGPSLVRRLDRVSVRGRLRGPAGSTGGAARARR